ncbi:hypothetical protein M413DRAFT_22996 [Hebeloma cylindrosporum]|uniref:Uncharacterized protein n=1 Tax=Hebeloma cylindrosporum TaxID=76867 RepID=A0A0C3CRW5_HEBCY|nr:hypothetical protein M413DRAFT_22996 [Hebeloma cylindrosporum h7]
MAPRSSNVNTSHHQHDSMNASSAQPRDPSNLNPILSATSPCEHEHEWAGHQPVTSRSQCHITTSPLTATSVGTHTTHNCTTTSPKSAQTPTKTPGFVPIHASVGAYAASPPKPKQTLTNAPSFITPHH